VYSAPLTASASDRHVPALRTSGSPGSPPPLHGLVGTSRAIQHVRAQVRAVAARDARTLILGPSGSGKELVARAIHALSSRQRGPFVAVNCAALPRELVDSLLFGFERGAFTGAVSRRRGFFELADNGTILLDEIAELAPEAQAKLLRVLDAPHFRRVGGETDVAVNVRVLAASNRDLRQRVRDAYFREDLFHRLDIVTIAVPPLVERREDIPELVTHLLHELGAGHVSLGPAAVEQLCGHSWPGNVRELRNVLERTLVFSAGRHIDVVDLNTAHTDAHSTNAGSIADAINDLTVAFAAAVRGGTAPPDLRDIIDRSLVEAALQLAAGNKTAAARWLNMGRKALARRLRADGYKSSRSSS